MAVVRLEVRSRTPFAYDYERIEGTVHYAVAPEHPANRAIVDLDKSPRGADGRVAYAADFCLLQPADPARGNGGLIVDVPNRGRKVAVRQLNRAPNEAIPTPNVDPGDGFLFRRGWTVAWTGWQWDVVRSDALMGIEAPTAMANGRPIEGWTICEFQPNEPARSLLLANRVHHPYRAADVGQPDAKLYERDWMDGPRREVPRDRWCFARDEAGQPVSDDAHVYLDGGFVPGRYYEVVYRTNVCPVVGVGLLAVRDWASFLRYGDAASGNPAAGRVQRSIGFGVSQSGRFLRHFLYLGLNVDEAGRPVFDGVLPHVAGARRGEFNHRYAQPSVQSTRSFGHLPPFGDDLLERQRRVAAERGRGGMPKVFFTNTSAEYWRGDCTLLHTDQMGTRDAEPAEDTRIYHFGGTQHGPGGLPLDEPGATGAPEGARGAHPFNAVDYAPLLRAALENLDRWITTGEAPPPSRFPRLDDGTAVVPAAALEPFRAIPGASVPAVDKLVGMRELDLGPEADRGVGRYPAAAGAEIPTYRPAVDADGNELSGIRLPDVAVPLATYTGWNPRHPETGAPEQLIAMQGSTFPFPATAEERAASGDPRAAIAERYRDREDYLSRVRAAAEQLVADRYLLAEDLELVVTTAAEKYDAWARASVPA